MMLHQRILITGAYFVRPAMVQGWNKPVEKQLDLPFQASVGFSFIRRQAQAFAKQVLEAPPPGINAIAICQITVDFESCASWHAKVTGINAIPCLLHPSEVRRLRSVDPFSPKSLIGLRR